MRIIKKFILFPDERAKESRMVMQTKSSIYDEGRIFRFRALPFSILLFIFLSLPSGAQASIRTFQFSDAKMGSIKIDVPPQWQDAQDLYGIPLVVLGPTRDGLRPSLSVTPTGIMDLQLDQSGLNKTQDEYKKGREAWLKNNGGQSISYLPYQVEKWKTIDVAHSIGYRYERGGKKFLEKSYYITCNRRLYHLKSLMTLEHEKEFGKLMNQTIKSFSCTGGGK